MAKLNCVHVALAELAKQEPGFLAISQNINGMFTFFGAATLVIGSYLENWMWCMIGTSQASPHAQATRHRTLNYPRLALRRTMLRPSL